MIELLLDVNRPDTLYALGLPQEIPLPAKLAGISFFFATPGFNPEFMAAHRRSLLPPWMFGYDYSLTKDR
jgi:hypothetical protein